MNRVHDSCTSLHVHAALLHSGPFSWLMAVLITNCMLPSLLHEDQYPHLWLLRFHLKAMNAHPLRQLAGSLQATRSELEPDARSRYRSHRCCWVFGCWVHAQSLGWQLCPDPSCCYIAGTAVASRHMHAYVLFYGRVWYGSLPPVTEVLPGSFICMTCPLIRGARAWPSLTGAATNPSCRHR
jgi:hypothetical protein